MTEPTEQVGIWCRCCGSTDLRTRKVRHRPGGVERRRVCKRCGTALLSFERVTHPRLAKRLQVANSPNGPSVGKP